MIVQIDFVIEFFFFIFQPYFDIGIKSWHGWSESFEYFLNYSSLNVNAQVAFKQIYKF